MLGKVGKTATGIKEGCSVGLCVVDTWECWLVGCEEGICSRVRDGGEVISWLWDVGIWVGLLVVVLVGVT